MSAIEPLGEYLPEHFIEVIVQTRTTSEDGLEDFLEDRFIGINAHTISMVYPGATDDDCRVSVREEGAILTVKDSYIGVLRRIRKATETVIEFFDGDGDGDPFGDDIDDSSSSP